MLISKKIKGQKKYFKLILKKFSSWLKSYKTLEINYLKTFIFNIVKNILSNQNYLLQL